MQTAASSTMLTSLETAILATIVYSDLFDFPLTRDEVLRWLPVPATAAEVDAALAGDALMPAYLSVVGFYVTLSGREEVVATRERRRAASATLDKEACRYGSWIARLPLVRMVAVTGSLAVDNADPGADLDYLIVTAPGRVWLTRALTMVLVRLAALRGVTLCPNYLLAATALAQPARDLYTARELLQMRPLAGLDLYTRMLDANPWWRDFLPNATPAIASKESSSPSIARRAAEALLSAPAFDALERWLMSRKAAEFARRQQPGDETCFDATMCKGHFDAWRGATERRAAERLQSLLESRS